MANRKASAFTVKTSVTDSDFHANANTGTNEKTSYLVLWNYVSGKIKGAATAIADEGTADISDSDYVIAIVATNAGGSDVTFSVGTSAGGSQIIEDEVVPAGETIEVVVNRYFAGATTLHFTLDTGSLSVRIIKQ